MKYVEIQGMPKFNFSYKFEAEERKYDFESSYELIEILYVSEGGFSIRKQNREYTAEAGDVVCIVRDAPIIIKTDGAHCYHTVSARVRWSFTDNHTNGLFLPIVTKHSKHTEKITETIDRLVFFSSKYDNSDIKFANEFLSIVCAIDEINRKNPEYLQNEISIQVEKAKKYIQKNIHSPITQTEVAEYLGISAGHLCRLFKKSEGVSLLKYVNDIKLRKIRLHVEIENMKLYEAAAMYGYSDPNYVSSLYKKTFGHNITSMPCLCDE